MVNILFFSIVYITSAPETVVLMVEDMLPRLDDVSFLFDFVHDFAGVQYYDIFVPLTFLIVS